MNYHQRMGILLLKKCVNRDKCSFATEQRMFGVFAIDEILRYRGSPFPASRTLGHPDVRKGVKSISWSSLSNRNSYNRDIPFRQLDALFQETMDQRLNNNSQDKKCRNVKVQYEIIMNF